MSTPEFGGDPSLHLDEWMRDQAATVREEDIAQLHFDEMLVAAEIEWDDEPTSETLDQLGMIAALLAQSDMHAEDTTVSDRELLVGLIASGMPPEIISIVQAYRQIGPLTEEEKQIVAQLMDGDAAEELADARRAAIIDELQNLLAEKMPPDFGMTDSMQLFLNSIVRICYTLRFDPSSTGNDVANVNLIDRSVEIARTFKDTPMLAEVVAALLGSR